MTTGGVFWLAELATLAAAAATVDSGCSSSRGGCSMSSPPPVLAEMRCSLRQTPPGDQKCITAVSGSRRLRVAVPIGTIQSHSRFYSLFYNVQFIIYLVI